LLLDSFTLDLCENAFAELAVDDWPRLPIKNIHILLQYYRQNFDMEACISILNKYRTSVEDIVIVNFELSLYELEKLLENMENLQKLTFNFVSMSSEVVNPLQLPKLTSLSVVFRYKNETNQSENMLRAFTFNKSIETLRVNALGRQGSTIFFRGLIETLPKMKHLTIAGNIDDEELLMELSQKLETLQIDSLNVCNDNVQFLLNQTELKELRLLKLPHMNTAALLRTIYERLDTFYLEEALLIRNFQPQHVERKLNLSWEAGLEILKRGPCEWNL
jgi:hypothetical protein